jgi:hypothetical protein
MSPLSRLLLTPRYGCVAVWLFVLVDKYCVVSRRTARAGLRASTRACTSKPRGAHRCPDRCEDIQESFPFVSSSLSVWLLLTKCARIASHVLCLCFWSHWWPRHMQHRHARHTRYFLCLWLGSLIDHGWMCSCSRSRLWCGRAILKPACQPASDSRCGPTACAQPSLTFHATQVQHSQDDVHLFCCLYRAGMICLGWSSQLWFLSLQVLSWRPEGRGRSSVH